MRRGLILLLLFCLTEEAFAGDSLSVLQVKVLISNWLAAQNAGSFEDYKALYANRFYGIRRSGSRTYGLIRSAWLKDRERMFKKTMVVKISDPQIVISGRTATVKFEQTWESGGYKDIGNKVLVVTTEEDKPKISGEEMLFSNVSKSIARTDQSPLSFAFAMKEGIVIPGFDSEAGSIINKPKLESKEPAFVSSVPVDKDSLPPSLQSLMGLPVRIYGAGGPCESRINGFKIISKEVPHFGQVQRWTEEKTPNQQIAAMVFTAGNRHLVATTEKCSGDFAKDARLPISEVAVGRRPERALRTKAEGLFKSLPEYQKEIKPYRKDSYEETIRTFTLTIDGKQTTWVSMFAEAGALCGDGGKLGALWRVVGSRKEPYLKLVRYLDEDVDYATDIENDGVPHFHFVGYLGDYFGFYSEKNRKEDKGLHSTAFHDCPC